MGFPLPVFGYVAQRGHYDLHNSKHRDGGWNRRNLQAVEHFMDSLRNLYPQCPAPGRFVFPWGSDDPLVFGGVHFEADNDERPTLHDLLHRLQGGGTIIVTDLEHLVDVDNEASVQLMLDYKGSRIGFLNLNRIRLAQVRNVADIDRLIKRLAENYTGVSDLVGRRARTLHLNRREIQAPRPREAA